MLRVKPLSGKFKEDLDIFNKMDPYVIFSLDGQVYKTAPHIQGGIHTSWHQQFMFDVDKVYDTKMNITIYDKDPIVDQFIGQASFDIKQWLDCPNETKVECINVRKRKNQLVGSITLQYKYDTSVKGGKRKN